MNDKTFTPIKAVIAVYAMPRYTKQQERENPQHSRQSKDFDTVLEDAMKPDDTAMEPVTTGCYSKDAKHVVGNASHFQINL